MMTTTVEIDLSHQSGLLTRAQAQEYRHLILDHINRHHTVKLDLGNLSVSPSFAVECFGLLIQNIGRAKFKSCVHLFNMSPASKAIILHVLRQRSQFATYTLSTAI